MGGPDFQTLMYYFIVFMSCNSQGLPGGSKNCILDTCIEEHYEDVVEG